MKKIHAATTSTLYAILLLWEATLMPIRRTADRPWSTELPPTAHRQRVGGCRAAEPFYYFRELSKINTQRAPCALGFVVLF